MISDLFRRNGRYSLPYLIYLHDEGCNIEMRFVNDVNDVEFDGHVYKAGSFDYVPNTTVSGFDGGGKLTITIKNNLVVDLIETYRNVVLEAVGALNQNGEITELKSFEHRYGSGKVNRFQAVFSFDKDDRLDMTFPALLWNRDNNKGNS
jgi:hypothetical protein